MTSPRSPREHQRVTVGVMLPEVHSYFGRALQGIEHGLALAGAALQLTSSDYEPRRESAALDSLLSRNVDGLILVPLLGLDEDAANRQMERLLQLPVPVVFMERRLGAAGAYDGTEHVVSDHAGGAFDAVAHLVSLGHERVGLAYRTRAYTSKGILAGYRLAAEHFGFGAWEIGEPQPSWQPDLAAEVGERMRRDDITAVLVFGDREATMIESALLRRGVRIPEDVALVSYDDEIADLAEVPLTAVSPAKHRMGRLSATCVLGRISEGAERPIHQIQLRPRIVVRRSCGASMAPEPLPITP